METVFLSLGSNLGDRSSLLEAALDALKAEVGMITKVSTMYESASWGTEEAQPDYLNLVVQIQTELGPEEVLQAAHRIEAALGRTRNKRWESRLIDIDVLFHGQQVVEQPHLQIPHPRIPERNFVLIPMVEIAPDFIHPQLGQSMQQLLANSPDKSPVATWTAFEEANMTYLNDLSEGDHGILLEMIQLFVDQTPLYLEQLEGYIASQQWTEAHARAHHIKPTLIYMGAESMHESLVALEHELRSEKVEKELVMLLLDRLKQRFKILFAELSEHLEKLKKKPIVGS